MSSVPASNLPPRKSFAQVAAAAHKPTISVLETSPNAIISASDDEGPRDESQPGAEFTELSQTEQDGEDGAPSSTSLKRVPTNLSDAVHAPSTAPSESGQLQIDGFSRRENSDTKSVASRTTLTLDEKESLRPDDSASVQAAVEEDSPAGSRVGSASDPDARAFRDQLHEIERNGPARYLAHRNMPAVLPRSTQQNGPISFPSSPAPVVQTTTSGDPENQRQNVPPVGHALPPDEKLLDALASPKDRLFVLKIEQDMIDFVKDSKENFLQLPQTNSFYRMLSHKLADYYCLSHVVDESLTSVRIYRTPHCRLPPPLIGPDPATGSSTPPPTAPARKIMRRGDTDEFGNIGSGTPDQSKTTSELDGSGSDDQKDKAALTREERENRYKEARARIFKDFKEITTPTGETGPPSIEADHSRSSSRSGVKKTKKTRKPRDDTFEARSAYSQFPNHQFVPNTFQQGTQDSLYNAFANLNVAGPYTAPPAGYQQGTPPYVDGSGAHQQSMQTMQWYPQPHQQQYAIPQGMVTPGHYTPQHGGHANGSFHGFQPYQSPDQATPKPSAPSLAYGSQGYQQTQVQVQGHGWTQQQYPQPYAMQQMYYGQQPGVVAMQPGSQMVYGYAGPQQDMSYYTHQNRGHFNPHSQTFIPAMPGAMIVPGQQFTGQQYHQSLQHPQQGYGNGGAPRFPMPMTPNSMMQRQHSNTSQASGHMQTPPQQHIGFQPQHQQHSSPRMPQQQVHSPAQGMLQHNNSARNAPSGNVGSPQPQHPQQHGSPSTISKWANAASLPSKPPAPASSLAFQVPQNSLGKQPLPMNPLIASTNSVAREVAGATMEAAAQPEQ